VAPLLTEVEEIWLDHVVLSEYDIRRRKQKAPTVPLLVFHQHRDQVQQDELMPIRR